MRFISEKKLIIGLRNGQYESYRLLFEEYYPNFVAFVTKLLKDSSAAEDIVQEAFTKIYINRARLDESKSLNNYIYVIVKRLVLNHIRDKRPVFFSELPAADLLQLGASSDPNGKIDANQLSRIVLEAVEKMPEQRREAFTLSRIKHYSNKEIAELMGLSVRTVEHHIGLALADIRKTLANL